MVFGRARRDKRRGMENAEVCASWGTSPRRVKVPARSLFPPLDPEDTPRLNSKKEYQILGTLLRIARRHPR